MTPVLLDTSVIVALLRARPSFVPAHWAQLHADTEAVLSSIVAAELAAGFRLLPNQRRERRAYAAIVDGVTTREFGFEAAEQYGRLRATLRKAGSSIGRADELIAGHALALGADVATLNAADFRRVPGLRVRDWSAAA